MQHGNKKKDQHYLAYRKALCHAQPFSRLLKMYLDTVFFSLGLNTYFPDKPWRCKAIQTVQT